MHNFDGRVGNLERSLERAVRILYRRGRMASRPSVTLLLVVNIVLSGCQSLGPLPTLDPTPAASAASVAATSPSRLLPQGMQLAVSPDPPVPGQQLIVAVSGLVPGRRYSVEIRDTGDRIEQRVAVDGIARATFTLPADPTLLQLTIVVVDGAGTTVIRSIFHTALARATPNSQASASPAPPPITGGAEVDQALVSFGRLMIPGACGGPDAVVRGIPSTVFGAQRRFSVLIQFTETVRVLVYESVGPTTVTHRVMGTTFNNQSDNFGFCCAVTSEVPGNYKFHMDVRVERTGQVVNLNFPYTVVPRSQADPRDEPQFSSGTTYDARYVYNAYVVTPDETRTGGDVVLCGRESQTFAAGSRFVVVLRLYKEVVSALAVSIGPTTVVHFDQTYQGAPQYVMAGCCSDVPTTPGSYVLEVTNRIADGATIVTRIPYAVTRP